MTTTAIHATCSPGGSGMRLRRASWFPRTLRPAFRGSVRARGRPQARYGRTTGPMCPASRARLLAGQITGLLRAWGDGDAAAGERLMPLIYEELRRRAAGHLRRERPGHTLRPTDLVHETYLRLNAQNPAWHNRAQFFAVASR